ncbi:MAG: hypothetical protein LH650_06275, partial [Chloroflexi bacterium]|nr:hypothetical protein [Chloroflexota bacterium]
MRAQFRRVLFTVLIIPSLLAGTALATVAGVALAEVQGSDCPSDPTRAKYWENVVGDTSHGNDQLWHCGGENDLTDIDHTVSSNCHSFLGELTWNDCVGSVTMWVPSGTRLCLYEHADYGGVKQT